MHPEINRPPNGGSDRVRAPSKESLINSSSAAAVAEALALCFAFTSTLSIHLLRSESKPLN